MKTIEEFLSAVDIRIYERGVGYYENGMVERLVRDGCHYSAKVHGSDWEPYDVDIQLSEEQEVKDWYCTCPYDGGDVCKHVVAMLLAVQNGKAKEKKTTPRKNKNKPSFSLEPLLSKASKKELAALILEHTKEDERFCANVLFALGAPDEQELSTAKEMIHASIRRNTHRGDIDMRGCDAICNDMDEVLETARRHVECGRFAAAIALALEMLHIGAKLASEADSSSGCLCDTMDYGLELLENAAASLQSGEHKKKQVSFDKILKIAPNKTFDDWEDLRYDLLNCAALLADQKSAPKLSTLLDELLAAAGKMEYGREYCMEANMETRFRLIETMEGAKAARDFLSQHLNFDRLRELAIIMDMDAGNYKRAEKLCLEKAETTSRNPYGSPSQWHELLCNIYRTAGQEKKLTAQLRTMLLLGKLECYDELKKRLQADGCWEQEYPSLLQSIAASRPCDQYMWILAKESELALLIEQVERKPDTVFIYGNQLAKQYPQRVYALCASQIRSVGELVQNRRDYHKLCSLLEKLIGYGGTAEASQLVMELRETYPRRSALQEELTLLERKAAKQL